MAEDINYGAILESLNDKVDLDSSCFSYPTTTRVALTISVNTETQFTAPADGWFVARTGATGGWLEVRNDDTYVGFSILGQNYNTLSCPARKGERVTVLIGGSVERFHFVYAQKTN